MKQKNFLKIALLIFFILSTNYSFGQSVVITTIVDGTLPNDVCGSGSGSSAPRFVELYVDGTINFSGYDLGVSVNGGSYTNKNISSLGTISDQFVYLLRNQDDKLPFESMFPGRTYIEIALGSINGNETFYVRDGSDTVLDTFGDPSEVSGSTDHDAVWDYLDSYAKRKDFITANGGTFVSDNWTYGGANALDGATCSTFSSAVNLGSFSLKTTIWDGDTTSDWNNTDNWDNGIPTPGYNVSIPDVATAPIIGASTQAFAGDLTITESDGLTINAGGSLIVNGTSSGNVTYNRTLTLVSGDGNGWHLVSSPVSGQTFNNAYANSNSIATSTTDITKRGIGSYNTSSNNWTYLINDDSNITGNFDSGSGIGYTMKRSATGSISFTGTINTGNINGISVSTAGDGFNLLGNPYTAYMSSKTFLDANTNLIAQIWTWSHGSGFEARPKVDDFTIVPGQGFFVQATSGTTVDFTESNQNSGTDNFQKSTNLKSEIKLIINDNEKSRNAKIYYFDSNVTKGYDDGYEGKSFTGQSSSLSIFSHLLEGSIGTNYQVQSLPKSEMESMIIPLGIKAVKGKEITISANVQNLPSSIKVFLEDRETNTLTRLDELNSSYKVTLTENIDGIGRFYLHTKSSSPLSVSEVNIENISIYNVNKSTLRITGVTQGKSNIKLFNILGKQVLKTSFNSKNGVKDISLPNLSFGIYIVQLETETGILNKKITIE